MNKRLRHVGKRAGYSSDKCTSLQFAHLGITYSSMVSHALTKISLSRMILCITSKVLNIY